MYGFREVSSGHLPYFSLNMNSGMDIESGTAILSNGQRSVVPSQARESSSPLTKRELRHPSGRCENHCSGVSPTRAAKRSCGCQCAQLVSARDSDIVNMGASTTDTAGSESRRNGGRDAKKWKGSSLGPRLSRQSIVLDCTWVVIGLSILRGWREIGSARPTISGACDLLLCPIKPA